MRRTNSISLGGVLTLLAIAVSLLVSSGWQEQITPDPKVIGPPLLSQPGKSGGQITGALFSAPSSFNPLVDPAAVELAPLFLVGLLELNALTGQIEPGLAERFEIAPDHKAVTFYLRAVKFPDGSPFSADDVLFTFNDVFLNEKVKTELLQFMREFFKEEGRILIRQVEKVDNQTVRFVLSRPLPASFLDFLTQMPILPKHKLAGKPFAQAWSIETKLEEIVGLGPFRLKEVERAGLIFKETKKIVFERNPFYWKVDEAGTQLPYLDQLTWLILKKPEEMLEKFRTGELDLLVPRPEDIPSLPPSAQLIKDGPEDLVYFLALNQDIQDSEKREVFRDVRFRRALAYATDRTSIVQQYTGDFAVSRESFIHPLSPYYDEASLVRYEFSLEHAAALLEEMGLKDTDGNGIRELQSGKELKLEFLLRDDDPVRLAIGRIYQENLSRIGIKVELNVIGAGKWRQRLLGRPPQYETTLAGSSFSIFMIPSTILELAAHFQSHGESHFYRFSDAQAKELPEAQRRIDEIFAQLPGTEDEKALFSELQKILSEDLPLIPLYSPQYLVALQPGMRNGERINAYGYMRFIEVLWKE